MKISCQKLYDARQILTRIFSEPLEFKLAYRLKRISSKINSRLKELEDKRIELVKKYADEQTPEMKAKNIPPRVSLRMEEFIHAFEETLEKEEEFEFQQIPFELIKGLRMSANELELLEGFIEDIPED